MKGKKEEEVKERKRNEKETMRRGKALVVKMKGGRGGWRDEGRDGRAGKGGREDEEWWWGGRRSGE